MATTLKKEPAFIQPPPGKSDITSGMQVACSGSIINKTGAADALFPGADIGRAPSASYTKVVVTS